MILPLYRRYLSRHFSYLLVGVGACVFSTPVVASPPSDGGQWRLEMSPYAYHFSRSPEHKPVYLIGVERVEPDESIVGMVYFSNSFGQPSLFIYPWGGITRDLFGVDGLTSSGVLA